MKKKFNIVDKNGTVFYLDAEVKTENGKQNFSMSGSFNGGGGQCYDGIKPANKYQTKLVEWWKTYHLNDMNAGTVKQSKIIDDYFKSSGVSYNYNTACKVLQSTKKDGSQFSIIDFELHLNDLREQRIKLKELNKQRDEIEKEFKELKQNVGRWQLASSTLYENIQLSRTDRTVKTETYKNQLFFNNIHHLESLKKRTLQHMGSLISETQSVFHEIAMQSMLYDLHPETNNPYQYGTAWLTYPLPDNFENDLLELIEKVEAVDLEDCPAKQFLKDTNTKFECSYKDFDYYFDGDAEKRSIFNITLSRPSGSYTFTFGQSIANGRTKPTEYDVLACLETYIPDTFEDFCSELGYDTDSISANETYKACEEQYYSLKDLFEPEELEKLTEIN